MDGGHEDLERKIETDTLPNEHCAQSPRVKVVGVKLGFVSR